MAALNSGTRCVAIDSQYHWGRGKLCTIPREIGLLSFLRVLVDVHVMRCQSRPGYKSSLWVQTQLLSERTHSQPSDDDLLSLRRKDRTRRTQVDFCNTSQ